MICLSDNDIIYKLASCNLLEDALAGLDVASTDVYVLPTAKYKFGLARRSSAKRASPDSDEVRTRIRDFLACVREIEVPGPPEELQLLSGVDGIDAGEAVLFSATANFEDYLLATGDKTSLRALATTPRVRPIAVRVRGHVICLEQIIHRVIQNFGFSYVKKKVLPAHVCDTALHVAFGSGREATEANVVAALDSYIWELRSLPIDLLC